MTVRARLASDVKQKGRVLLTKGALVTGRVTRMEQHNDYNELGLEFDQEEGGRAHAALGRQGWIPLAGLVSGDTNFSAALCPGASRHAGRKHSDPEGRTHSIDPRHRNFLENRNVIHLSSETGDLFAQAFSYAQRQVRKLTEKHPWLLSAVHAEWRLEVIEGPGLDSTGATDFCRA